METKIINWKYGLGSDTFECPEGPTVLEWETQVLGCGGHLNDQLISEGGAYEASASLGGPGGIQYSSDAQGILASGLILLFPGVQSFKEDNLQAQRFHFHHSFPYGYIVHA